MVFVVICFTYVYIVSSEAFAVSTKYIANNQRVKAAFGNPVKCRLAFWGYSIKTVGPTGSAHFQVYVSGPLGKGTVYIVLEKQNLWHVTSASLRVGTSVSEIPLLPE